MRKFSSGVLFFFLPKVKSYFVPLCFPLCVQYSHPLELAKLIGYNTCCAISVTAAIGGDSKPKPSPTD